MTSVVVWEVGESVVVGVRFVSCHVMGCAYQEFGYSRIGYAYLFLLIMRAHKKDSIIYKKNKFLITISIL